MAIVSGWKWVSLWGALSHLSPLATVRAQTGINQNTYPWQDEVKPMNFTFPSQLGPPGTPLLLETEFSFPST